MAVVPSLLIITLGAIHALADEAGRCRAGSVDAACTASQWVSGSHLLQTNSMKSDIVKQTLVEEFVGQQLAQTESTVNTLESLMKLGLSGKIHALGIRSRSRSSQEACASRAAMHNVSASCAAVACALMECETQGAMENATDGHSPDKSRDCMQDQNLTAPDGVCRGQMCQVIVELTMLGETTFSEVLGPECLPDKCENLEGLSSWVTALAQEEMETEGAGDATIVVKIELHHGNGGGGSNGGSNGSGQIECEWETEETCFDETWAVSGCAPWSEGCPCTDGEVKCGASDEWPGFCTAICCDWETEQSCHDENWKVTGCALWSEGCPCADDEVKCGVSEGYGGWCQPEQAICCDFESEEVCYDNNWVPVGCAPFSGDGCPCADGEVKCGQKEDFGGWCQPEQAICCDFQTEEMCYNEYWEPSGCEPLSGGGCPCADGQLKCGQEEDFGGWCQPAEAICCDYQIEDWCWDNSKFEELCVAKGACDYNWGKLEPEPEPENDTGVVMAQQGVGRTSEHASRGKGKGHGKSRGGKTEGKYSPRKYNGAQMSQQGVGHTSEHASGGKGKGYGKSHVKGKHEMKGKNKGKSNLR